MIKLFNERRIEDAFSVVLRNAQKRIDSLGDQYIYDHDLQQIANEIATSLQLKQLVIDLNNRKANVVMKDIPWNMFPPGTDVRRGVSYPCALVNYTFSVDSGDMELLTVHPRTSAFNFDIPIAINKRNFVIGYQTKYANPKLSDKVKSEVKQGMKKNIDSMKIVIDAINKEVNEFNESIEGQIMEVLEKTREEIKERREQNKDLNTF